MADTFLCSNCGFSLNLSRAGEEARNAVSISNPAVFLRKVKEVQKEHGQAFGTVLMDSNIRFTFTEQELVEHLKSTGGKSKKMTQQDIDAIVEEFRKLNKAHRSNIILRCTTCASTFPLPHGTTIYSLTLHHAADAAEVEVDTDVQEDMDDSVIDFMITDPTLPRSKDYICRNQLCPTHTDRKVKEAVFFRTGSSYITKYACCVCKSHWQV